MIKGDYSIIWTSQEAAIVTGGQNTREWCASGIALRVEDITPGDLFVASQNDDLQQVFEKGAAAIMCTGGTGGYDALPVLRVPDIYQALQSMARAARFKTHATIIAVQGKSVRQDIAGTLSNVGGVHRTGRHLSLGLASLPLDADYGVFGLSPSVQPDIAVITDCESAHRDTLFENMPRHGVVVINADSEGFLSVLSRAKAAGLTQLYTYGRRENADVRLCDMITASNGVRATIEILGERYTSLKPVGFEYDDAFLVSLLVMKLTDKCVDTIMMESSDALSRKKDAENGITLVPSVPEFSQAVFRVTNMIDLGFGRQTAMLDNISEAAHNSFTLRKKSLAMPRKLANLDFVYTSKRLNAVSNARDTIRQTQGYAKVETITPDVVAPGDFLVFKDVWNKSKAALSEVLRSVPETRKRKSRTS